MKNKNEVTEDLMVGCTVLRITPEFPGAVTTFLLEHAAGMDHADFYTKWHVYADYYTKMSANMSATHFQVA